MTQLEKVAYVMAALTLVGYGCMLVLNFDAQGSVNRALLLSRVSRKGRGIIHSDDANVSMQPRREELEFLRRTKGIQQARQNRLHEACAAWRAESDITVNVLKPAFARTFNVDDFDLTYCAIPKCASTTWFGFFERATKRECKRKVSTVHKCARNKFESPISRNQFLSHSFVVVRNPWRRLVSAYTDKFVSERHALAEACYESHGVGLHANQPLTFAQFVECILRDYEQKVPLNAHVALLHWQCSLCEVQYTDIVTLETMKDDFRYLAKYVFPGKNARVYGSIFASGRRRKTELGNVTLSTYEDCYDSLTSEALTSLTKIYERDALLFDYPTTPFS